jgi:hypothetical protein
MLHYTAGASLQVVVYMVQTVGLFARLGVPSILPPSDRAPHSESLRLVPTTFQPSVLALSALCSRLCSCLLAYLRIISQRCPNLFIVNIKPFLSPITFFNAVGSRGFSLCANLR